jgi:hypothetical protein
MAAENMSGPSTKVVGFIHQESVGATLLGKVASQIHPRIKNIIVIADDGVSPDGHVQRKLEGADLMFLAHGFEHRAGNFFLFQRFADPA